MKQPRSASHEFILCNIWTSNSVYYLNQSPLSYFIKLAEGVGVEHPKELVKHVAEEKPGVCN